MPEVIEHLHDLLYSINERLGGNAGLDVPRLGVDYLDDVIQAANDESEEAEHAQEELARTLRNR